MPHMMACGRLLVTPVYASAIVEETTMDLLTVREAAGELRMSPMTVRRYIAAGKLRAVRAGRAIRIERSALDEFATPVRPAVDDADDAELVGRSLSFDDPIWPLVGLIDDDGPTDVSVNHDRYLAGAYADTHER